MHYQPRHVKHRLSSYLCSNRGSYPDYERHLTRGMLISHAAWGAAFPCPLGGSIREDELLYILKTYGNKLDIDPCIRKAHGRRNNEIIYITLFTRKTLYHSNGR